MLDQYLSGDELLKLECLRMAMPGGEKITEEWVKEAQKLFDYVKSADPKLAKAA